MNVNHKVKERPHFETTHFGTAQFVGKIRKGLKLRLIEQKALRELLEIDNLTINGIALWKNGQLVSNYRLKHRKK